jgi:hypothetical protein
MYYFEEIINRLKTKLGFTTDKELYDLMDVRQGTFTNWRSRNKIPYEEITTICVNKNFNLNYILGGETEENIELNIDYKNEIISNLELLDENQIKYIYHITEAEKIKKIL